MCVCRRKIASKNHLNINLFMSNKFNPESHFLFIYDDNIMTRKNIGYPFQYGPGPRAKVDTKTYLFSF